MDTVYAPRTVKDAVERLMKVMTPKEKEAFKNEVEFGVAAWDSMFGKYIRNEFGLWGENRELLRDCNGEGNHLPHPDDATVVILDALWHTLQEA